MENNKKNKSLWSHAALASVVVPLSFGVQEAQAQVTIIVSAPAEINFGSMTESGAGGTIQMLTDGTRIEGGGVTAVTGTGLEGSGTLLIAGSTGLPIDLSMTAASFTVSAGGTNMVVNNFNLVTVAGGSVATVTLGSNPSSVSVGATLVVAGGQMAGTYTGSYMINVNYQ